MASRCRPVSQPKRNVAPATGTKSAVARKVSTTSGALSGTKAIVGSFSGRCGGRQPPEAALAPVELLERRPELGHGKIRPQGRGEVKLGVGALPEQEVAQAQLAAGAEEEVDVGGAAGDKPGEIGRRVAVEAARGLDDGLARGGIDGQAQGEIRAPGGGGLGDGDGFAQFRRQPVASADHRQASAVLGY